MTQLLHIENQNGLSIKWQMNKEEEYHFNIVNTKYYAFNTCLSNIVNTKVFFMI